MKKGRQIDVSIEVLSTLDLTCPPEGKHDVALRQYAPAMEAGIADHVWSIEEIAALIPEPVAKKRGPYKKQAQVAEISN